MGNTFKNLTHSKSKPCIICHSLTCKLGLGNGTTLENRRFFQSGLDAGVFKRQVVFIADGGVTIATPGRMRTGKNGALKVLPHNDIKKKKNLQALKGTRQTHASSLKWADNVYAGLDFSCRQASDARGPLAHIFVAFDPISRMFATHGRYTSCVFDTVMAHYHDPLIRGRLNLLNTAKSQLRLLGMEREMVDEIVEAAKRL